MTEKLSGAFIWEILGAWTERALPRKTNVRSGKWYMQYIFDNVGGYSIRINAAGEAIE